MERNLKKQKQYTKFTLSEELASVWVAIYSMDARRRGHIDLQRAFCELTDRIEKFFNVDFAIAPADMREAWREKKEKKMNKPLASASAKKRGT